MQSELGSELLRGDHEPSSRQRAGASKNWCCDPKSALGRTRLSPSCASGLGVRMIVTDPGGNFGPPYLLPLPEIDTRLRPSVSFAPAEPRVDERGPRPAGAAGRVGVPMGPGRPANGGPKH